MSIREEWIAHIQNGRLFKLNFLIEGRPEKRTVLMSPEINTLVRGPWQNNLMGDRCARLRADLENILAGEKLTVCWEPFKARRHQIGRLDPPHEFIFDLRSSDPPGLRVIFYFAEKDVIVALICSPRSIPIPWLKRLPLLGRESKEWHRAIRDCGIEWRNLFPKYAPLQGQSINDLLSNAVLI